MRRTVPSPPAAATRSPFGLSATAYTPPSATSTLASVLHALLEMLVELRCFVGRLRLGTGLLRIAWIGVRESSARAPCDRRGRGRGRRGCCRRR